MEKDPDVHGKMKPEPYHALGQQFCGVFVLQSGLRFRIGIALIHNFTKMRIRTRLLTFLRIRMDPAPHQSDANPRPLVCRSSATQF
jgi:hypothetical protein